MGIGKLRGSSTRNDEIVHGDDLLSAAGGFEGVYHVE